MSTRLAEQEAVLSRLEITRETMSEILEDDDGPIAGRADGEASESVPVNAVRPGVGSPVGVRLVPNWSPQVSAAVLPQVYGDVVEVLVDAVHPMRAHHLAAVLGLPTDKNKVEGFRSKLKRLVVRGWLTETEPGLFAAREDLTAVGRAPERGQGAGERTHAGAGSGPRL